MYTEDFAKKYSEEELVEKREILLPVFNEILKNRNWKKLIDLGCGPGYYARKFVKKGNEIVGVDSNINQLNIARKIEEKTKLGIKYIQSELNNLKDINSDSFDVAFLNFVIVEISDKEVIRKIFNEAFRVLRKGGILITGQVHPHNINRDGKIVKKTLLDNKRNYFSEGSPAISKTLLENGEYLTFNEDYHYSLEFILNGLSKSGFKLNMIKEASLGEDYPSHIIIVEEK